MTKCYCINSVLFIKTGVFCLLLAVLIGHCFCLTHRYAFLKYKADSSIADKEKNDCSNDSEDEESAKSKQSKDIYCNAIYSQCGEPTTDLRKKTYQLKTSGCPIFVYFDIISPPPELI